jgi:molecular chaperone HtpG
MSDTATPDMQANAQVPGESLEYRTEVKQLLDILAHSLYSDREIFLRELISNASDALNRVQFEMLTNHTVIEPDRELAIRLAVSDESDGVKEIVLSDSGIGMNHDELIQNLGTIAHSGARTFLKNAGEGKATQEEIIGQFGVGFYAVFMVAEEVTVTSRSYRPDETAWQWRSTGDSRFTLTPAEKSERGTEIRIRLKEDAAEFANSWRLERIVKKHSDYVSFPIYLVEAEGERAINKRTALWRQTPSKVEAAEYTEFYKQLTFDENAPQLHAHLVADAPVNVRAVLFVPSKRERSRLRNGADFGLRLYSRKVLIQEHNKDLLPEYLRFVEGVVDSEDVPLNVSREMVQSNPIMRQLKKALTGRVLKEFKGLAESDEAKYGAFWQEFGQFLKEGIAAEPGAQENVVDLLRFRTSRTAEGEWASLKQVAERMQPEQKALYYVVGDNIKTVARSPHLDAFRKQDLEVLYLTDPIDGWMITYLREYNGTPLQTVDASDLDLPAVEETPQSAEAQSAFDALVARCKSVLGERVKDVRAGKTLVDSPARLVSAEEGFERDLQYVRRLMEEEYTAPVKILELNANHPIVSSLAALTERNGDDPRINDGIEQLLDNLLLMEGTFTGSVADLVDRVQRLMKVGLEK